MLDVLDVLEVMRCVLLCMLEVLEVLEKPGGALQACRRGGVEVLRYRGVEA